MSGLNFLCSGELVCEFKSVTQPVPRQSGAKLGIRCGFDGARRQAAPKKPNILNSGFSRRTTRWLTALYRFTI
jgi:hypothetical protein